VDRPETQYVAVGDADVAYQVFGDGPVDLLCGHGLGSHVEYFWDLPEMANFLAGLASFSRLILFDRRGTGASDGVPSGSIPTWEDWAEDLGAVLDAAGSKKAAVLGLGEVGAMAILYAVSHPERVTALMLYNATARYLVADDYPIGYPQDAVDDEIESLRTSWGKADFVARLSPGIGDAHHLEQLARLSRASATPRAAAAQFAYLAQSIDVRHVLPLIQVPTLVFALRDTPIVSIEHGRYLADHIDGAKLVELPGGDYPGANPSMLVEEIGEFLTGERPAVLVDRILTTVVFIDIVDSTKRAAALGDHRWRELLTSFYQTVRALLRQFRGVEIDTAGDGFFATFDGPARAIRCTRAITEAVGELGLCVRAGLHTGEVELDDGKVSGLAVHIGARVGAAAGPGEILVTRTLTELVIGSGLNFQDRGGRVLKGVPGTWRVFSVVG
jgi:class 3 adenylate cyclase